MRSSLVRTDISRYIGGMIRHIVFFSAKDNASIPTIITGLRMLADIGEAQCFEVRENLKQDGIGNEVDVVVYAEFADAASLARYKAHPTYQQCIRVVRPLRELRLAADVLAD